MKKKKKHKWQKQIGDFLLKKPIYGQTQVFIEVYYKNELIGVAHFSYIRKENTFLIKELDNAFETIGLITFEGIHHRLPKKITDISLKHNHSKILIQKRQVILEKHKGIKTIELGFSMTVPYIRNI